VDTTFLHNYICQLELNHSCFFNYDSGNQHLMSSASLDTFVDIIHDISCVDIVYYNTGCFWSFRPWTYIFYTTCSLCLHTCNFWETLTQTPMSNLLLQANHRFFTWLLYADCFKKHEIHQQVHHAAGLVCCFLFLMHNF